MRVELQMALDSKDSDIEQLRSLLNSVNVHSLDSASMSSGPEFDTDESLPGCCFFFNYFFVGSDVVFVLRRSLIFNLHKYHSYFTLIIGA